MNVSNHRTIDAPRYTLRTVPKEQPLQSLGSLQVIFEAKGVVFVVFFFEVKKLGTRLHGRERRALGVVHKNRYTSVGIDSQEPIFLLLVRHDVATFTFSATLTTSGREGFWLKLHFGGVPGQAIQVR